jgi:hypothetical protein
MKLLDNFYSIDTPSCSLICTYGNALSLQKKWLGSCKMAVADYFSLQAAITIVFELQYFTNFNPF